MLSAGWLSWGEGKSLRTSASGLLWGSWAYCTSLPGKRQYLRLIKPHFVRTGLNGSEIETIQFPDCTLPLHMKSSLHEAHTSSQCGKMNRTFFKKINKYSPAGQWKHADVQLAQVKVNLRHIQMKSFCEVSNVTFHHHFILKWSGLWSHFARFLYGILKLICCKGQDVT